MTVRIAFMPAKTVDFTRQPLVFTHIPKTAGTTVNFALDSAFPGQGAFHLQRRSEQELKELAADTAMHVYSGHLTYQQLAAAFTAAGRHPLYVTVLRDPIDRILSEYAYARETTEAGRWHALASTHDIDAFIAIMAKEHRQFLVGKQCRFVSAEKTANADQAFDSLKKNFAVIGVQRNLEGFLSGIERVTGLGLPRSEPHNQTAKRVFKEELAKKTLRILERTTKEDRRLYDMTLECLAE
jgi:hypothetical protein